MCTRAWANHLLWPQVCFFLQTFSHPDSGVHIPGSNPKWAHLGIWGMLMKFSKSCVLMCPWANHGTNPSGFLWAVGALTAGVAHCKCYSQAVVLKELVLRQHQQYLWDCEKCQSPGLPEKLWEEYPAPCIWEALQVILIHAQIWELLWGSTLRGTLWHRRPGDTTNFRTLCPLSSTKWQNVSEISIFQHQNSYLPGTLKCTKVLCQIRFS